MNVRLLGANVGAIKAEACFEIGLCAEGAHFSTDLDFLTGQRECHSFFFSLVRVIYPRALLRAGLS